jgi:hypothetical protein
MRVSPPMAQNGPYIIFQIKYYNQVLQNSLWACKYVYDIVPFKRANKSNDCFSIYPWWLAQVVTFKLFLTLYCPLFQFVGGNGGITNTMRWMWWTWIEVQISGVGEDVFSILNTQQNDIYIKFWMKSTSQRCENELSFYKFMMDFVGLKKHYKKNDWF